MTATDPGQVEAVLLRGPVGAGKTSTAATLSEILGDHGVAHAALDLDWLCTGSPRLHPWNIPVRDKHVALLAESYRSFGAERFILAGVVESRGELDDLAVALGVDRIVACGLRAPIEVVHERLRHRDTGPSLAWHLPRAVVLTEQMSSDGIDDLEVDTAERDHRAVALEIGRRVGWLPPA